MRLRGENRRWWALIGTCFGLALLMLDSTVVSLALTEIQREFDASQSALQWVINGYLLVLAVLMVTVGRIGDLFGRRRIFLVGMAVFAAGSVLAGAAWSIDVLIVARIVQATGGSALLALSLAIVCNAFPKEEQPRALGIWSAVSAIALALGPMIGGALVQLDWRLIFWINLPLAALGMVITWIAARESRDESARQRIDVPGVLVLSAGLTAIIFALIRSDAWGLGSAQTIALFCAGLVLLALFFFWVERRVAQPIVDLELFRNREYLGASAAAFTLISAYWTVMFYEPQYLQKILDNGPTLAGAMILPITGPIVALSPFTGRLLNRLGSRILMTAGIALGAVGLALLTGIGAESSYLSLLPGFVLFGISLGLVYAPMSTVAMGAMPKEKSGIAAGVLAMIRLVAGAVGLAIVGAVFEALRTDNLDAGEGGGEAFASALGSATWILVGLLAAGAVASWLLLRGTPHPPKVPEEPEHRIQHRRFHL